jgi:hypothetical protein
MTPYVRKTKKHILRMSLSFICACIYDDDDDDDDDDDVDQSTSHLTSNNPAKVVVNCRARSCPGQR